MVHLRQRQFGHGVVFDESGYVWSSADSQAFVIVSPLWDVYDVCEVLSRGLYRRDLAWSFSYDLHVSKVYM